MDRYCHVLRAIDVYNNGVVAELSEQVEHCHYIGGLNCYNPTWGDKCVLNIRLKDPVKLAVMKLKS